MRRATAICSRNIMVAVGERCRLLVAIDSLRRGMVVCSGDVVAVGVDLRLLHVDVDPRRGMTVGDSTGNLVRAANHIHILFADLVGV